MKKSKKENENSKQASLNKAGVEVGEQIPLIDVSPEHSKEIAQIGREYKKSVRLRRQALANEVTLKRKLLELIKEEHLQRLDDGTIKCHCDGVEVLITPQDDKVKITEDSEAA